MNNDDVLQGKDGFLFLSGGQHQPLRFAQAGESINEESTKNFWLNIHRRQTMLSRRGIRFAHLIAPDKHTVCQDAFPIKIATFLGDEYLKAAPSDELKQNVCYPREDLCRDYQQHCYRVDTHFRTSGTMLMLNLLLSRIQGIEVKKLLPETFQVKLRRESDWEGDLGSKMSPPWTEERASLVLPKSIRKFSNRLAGGNNGIIDLYINCDFLKEESPQGLGRVLVFGDSYGRDLSSCLSLACQEVLFMRTPFLHPEVVDAMKPDIVLTENAERYLSWVRLDEDRPFFFLYPFLKDNTCSMGKEMADALSAILSFGRKPYTAYMDSLHNSLCHD
jgi:hypothetical protein